MHSYFHNKRKQYCIFQHEELGVSNNLVKLGSQMVDTYSILFYPISLGGHQGATNEFATIPFHLVLFSAAIIEQLGPTRATKLIPLKQKSLFLFLSYFIYIFFLAETTYLPKQNKKHLKGLFSAGLPPNISVLLYLGRATECSDAYGAIACI